MQKYFLIAFLFLYQILPAQQISFKQTYPKGENARITTFTELKSFDFILSYNKVITDVAQIVPNILELHLMKVDKNGLELWDKVIRRDTTTDTTSRFSTQSIAEQTDGSLVLDITYPYGEKYLVKFDAAGNQAWEMYLHNCFGDLNIPNQFLKQKGKNLALPDGSAVSIGASFVNVNPSATLSIVDKDGIIPIDYPYYRGYFNDAFYINNYNIYVLGVQQTDSNEILVLSNLSTTTGIPNFHIPVKAHTSSEIIHSTALCYTYNKIRVAESVTRKDSLFFVNVYDYDYAGHLINTATYKLNYAATTIDLSYFETDYVLNNKCKAEVSQTIEKIDLNNHLVFSFTDSFDSVFQLKKVHDGNYVFAFTRGTGISFLKFSSKGTSEGGSAAEGYFYPNPAKDMVSMVGGPATFNHAMDLRLFDMTGNTLQKLRFEPLQPVVLNLSNIREGMYPYTIVTDEGITLKGKIVINRKN